MGAAVLLALAVVAAAPGAARAWGAIAVEDERGMAADDVGYGVSVDHDNEDAARAAAMRECRRSDNVDCRVVLTFRACGAYASSRRHSGVGEGSTKERARRAAIDACGHDRCDIVVAECD